MGGRTSGGCGGAGAAAGTAGRGPGSLAPRRGEQGTDCTSVLLLCSHTPGNTQPRRAARGDLVF